MVSNQRIKTQILRALALGKKTFWELINYQDSHLVEFLENLKDLLQEKKVSYQKPYFSLTHPYDGLPYKDPGCLHCSPFTKDPFWQELYEKFQSLTKNRPLPTSEFDQGFIRPIDTIKRVAFMYERGDLEGKDLILVGDDDLLSVALALTGLPKRIVVVEIDKRINDFIRKKAQDLSFPKLEVYNYNVINQLPSELKGQFDVFFTDPVETEKGLKLFVSRCITALRGVGSIGYMGFTHLEASLKKWYQFESFLIKSGFVITDILRDFTIYPEGENQWEDFYRTYRVMKEFDLDLPNVDWYKSSLIRFEIVEGPRHLPIDKPKDLKELYFDEEAWATPLPSFVEKNSPEED